MNINIVLILVAVLLVVIFNVFDKIMNTQFFVIHVSEHKSVNLIIQLVIITIGVYTGFYAPQFLF